MPTFRFHHMLSRNYIIFVVLLCSLASYLCYTLIASRASVDRRDSLVSKTYQVINIAEQTTALLEGMLAAQRGYILSGDERFLEKYDHKKSTVSEQLAQLTELTSKNQTQQSRLDEARTYFVMFANQLEERAARFHPQAVIGPSDDVTVIDNLRENLARISDAILAEEYALLERRINTLEREKQNYVDTLLVGIIVGTVLLLVLNAFLLSAHQGRTQAEASLKESEERFALAVDGTQDGIFDWDLPTQRLYCSDQFFRLLGVDKPANYRVEQFVDQVHPDDRSKVWASVAALEASDKPEYHAEFRMRHQSGRWIWIQARGKIIYDRQHKPVRIVGAHTDISEIVRSNEKLQAEKELAQKANRAKSEFLAHMSHEIRTPLTAISGIAEILQRQSQSLNERQQKMVHTLTLSSAALKDLINDVLDFSRIESGEVELQTQNFNLGQLFEELVSMMALRANEKGISFLCDYSEIRDHHYRGDRARIRQICVNLISNAIKFTDEGKVSVHAWFEERNGAPFLRVDVADTGIGISADDFELIFERFKQVNSSESRKYGGSGLGLAISRNLAQLMGGTIVVSSTPGAGSTFSLLLPQTLPMTASEPRDDIAPAADFHHRIRAVISEHTRILLVEDYSGNIVLVGYLLEELGIPYDVATTGVMALDLWQDRHYDLILMDIQMPEMDGYTATRTIRQQEQDQQRPRTPIIGMTAHALMGDKDQCIDAGMDTYLPKPIVEADLQRQLLTWLSVAGRQQSA
jgi:PAS domain S-box-containing protein